MIEGFKIDLASAELKGHLEAKSREHERKSQDYGRQADGVAQLQDPTGTSNDPVSSLRNSARAHAAKATYFAFIAEHVIADEVYRLSEVDLERLEFFSRYG